MTNINDRGEFTDADGRLWHHAHQESLFVSTKHEGPWLNCDGCNPVLFVTAPHQSYGAELRAEMAEAKTEADAANARLKAASDKVKTFLTDSLDGKGTRAELHVPGYRPLAFTYVESLRLDNAALKKAHPALYVEFVKPSGSWRLEERKGEQS